MHYKWTNEDINWQIQFFKRQLLPAHFERYNYLRNRYKLLCMLHKEDEAFLELKRRYERHKRWLNDTISGYKKLRAMLKECRASGLGYVEFEGVNESRGR